MILPSDESRMTPKELTRRLPLTALAFRGYNVANLGRSQELLAHPRFGPTVTRYLTLASQAAAEFLQRGVDLVTVVREGQELPLEAYGEAVALVMAMEGAQLELLRLHFDVPHETARLSFGFSLGELAALVAGGVLELPDALKAPLTLADDCVALSRDVGLGIFFTRSAELPLDDVRRLLLVVNSEGQGVIGISAHLSPNSMLLMGQRDTLDRFRELAHERLAVKVQLRRHSERWPPLHTPIMWEKQIPNRAASIMHTLPFKLMEPRPQVLSLVTGRMSYTDYSARSIMHQWVDHPQRLWDAVYESLSIGIRTVIHVGPAPNIIPATYKRLADNVRQQAQNHLSMRMLSAAARRPWLKALLPQRTALLRAPFVEHLILEDWLLAHAAEAR
jgi:[acyl-carrier-protein] S-malonyltransferase